MKITSFVLYSFAFVTPWVHTTGQEVRCEVGKARGVSQEKNVMMDCRVIGNDGKNYHTLRQRSGADYFGVKGKSYIGTWDKTTLEFVEEKPMKIDLPGAKFFMIEGAFSNGSGIHVLLSAYNKENNERSLYRAKMDPMTGNATEMTVLHTTKKGGNVEAGMYYVFHHRRTGRFAVAHFTMQYGAKMNGLGVIAMPSCEGPFEILVFDESFNKLHHGEGVLSDKEKNHLRSVYVNDRGDAYFLTATLRSVEDGGLIYGNHKVATLVHGSTSTELYDLAGSYGDSLQAYGDRSTNKWGYRFTESPRGQVFLLRYRGTEIYNTYGGVEWHSFDAQSGRYAGMKLHRPVIADFSRKEGSRSKDAMAWWDVDPVAGYWMSNDRFVDVFIRNKSYGVKSYREHAITMEIQPDIGYSPAVWCGADKQKGVNNDTYPEGFFVIPDTADRRSVLIGVASRGDLDVGCSTPQGSKLFKKSYSIEVNDVAGLFYQTVTSEGFNDRRTLHPRGDCWLSLSLHPLYGKVHFHEVVPGEEMVFVDLSFPDEERRKMRLVRVRY